MVKCSESSSEYNERHVLPVVCLTSVATIIGSGILALPVTLYKTPIPIFLSLLTLALLAQIGAVYAVVELLQRARHSQFTYSSSAEERILQQDLRRPSWADVSLYTTANLFLKWRFTRIIFHVSTLGSMVALLVSYGLAGPQAIWQMIAGSANITVVPTLALVMYWALFTFAVIVYVDTLLPVFGSFTVLKGVLFIGVILIVASLPTEARVENMSHLFSDLRGWTEVASPFLMCCVALGGLANTCPVTFNLLPAIPRQGQIRRYRGAVILALFICYLLNIGWVLAVLLVVPRDAEPGLPSLTEAYRRGQISTVPLLATLTRGTAVNGAILRAIEISIGSFIVVSTAVSFFVIAAGLKSFVDGFAKDIAQQSSSVSPKWTRLIAYTFSFGFVLLLVVCNPEGFINVLTRFSSLGLNSQAGFLLFIMLHNCRNKLYESAKKTKPDTSAISVKATNPPEAAQDCESIGLEEQLEAGFLQEDTGTQQNRSRNKPDVSEMPRFTQPAQASLRSYESIPNLPPNAALQSSTLSIQGAARNADSLDVFVLRGRQELMTLHARDPTKASVPVVMSDCVFAVNIGFSFPFFLLASLLAAFGPYLGIKLGHE